MDDLPPWLTPKAKVILQMQQVSDGVIHDENSTGKVEQEEANHDNSVKTRKPRLAKNELANLTLPSPSLNFSERKMKRSNCLHRSAPLLQTSNETMSDTDVKTRKPRLAKNELANLTLPSPYLNFSERKMKRSDCLRRSAPVPQTSNETMSDADVKKTRCGRTVRKPLQYWANEYLSKRVTPNGLEVVVMPGTGDVLQKGMEARFSKKPPAKKRSRSKLKKETTVTKDHKTAVSLIGRKGTMKRRKNLRNLIQLRNINHEDDAYNETPYKAVKPQNLGDLDDDANASYLDFSKTPHFAPVSPAMTQKTPFNLHTSMSPTSLPESVGDRMVHRLKNSWRGQKNILSRNHNDKCPEKSPQKRTMLSLGDTPQFKIIEMDDSDDDYYFNSDSD